MPHALWVLGMPVGISERALNDIERDLSTPTGVAIALTRQASWLGNSVPSPNGCAAIRWPSCGGG